MSPRQNPALARVLLRVDQLADGEIDHAILSSGFPSLDRALGGGFRRGCLHILGGDVGVGCSALALALVLRGRASALFLTSEMLPERVYERALTITASVELDAIRLGAVDEDERIRLAKATLDLRDHALAIEVLGDDGVAAVRRAADQVPNATLLIVDGLEALVPEGSNPRPRKESLALAVLELKRLALARNVAVVLLSHLPGLDTTRADCRPRLTDFGDGGAVGVHADVVLGLYREELYDGDIGVIGAAELLVLKRRDGVVGYVDLFYKAEFLRFEEVFDEGE